jgi:hypothetical protein
MPSGEAQSRKTHCVNGHPYDEENTQRKIGPDGKQERVCRTCARLRARRNREVPGRKERDAAATRKWRAENGERYNELWRANRQRAKAWVDAQKIACIKCSEDHPACLEFHHRNPSEKDFLISQAVAKCSLKRIQAEIAKCDVLCSNCHRKLHWETRHTLREELRHSRKKGNDGKAKKQTAHETVRDD